jgi:hypothetical protein
MALVAAWFMPRLKVKMTGAVSETLVLPVAGVTERRAGPPLPVV